MGRTIPVCLTQIKAGRSAMPYDVSRMTITAAAKNRRTRDGRDAAECSRIAREKRTIRAMIGIYCRARHGGRRPCADCAALEQYALGRLDRCPFGAEKTPCAKCSIHCYGPTMRARVKEVMQYAGPRMLWRHPILRCGTRGRAAAPPQRRHQGPVGRISQSVQRRTMQTSKSVL